jgi:hypothetical protein
VSVSAAVGSSTLQRVASDGGTPLLGAFEEALSEQLRACTGDGSLARLRTACSHKSKAHTAADAAAAGTHTATAGGGGGITGTQTATAATAAPGGDGGDGGGAAITPMAVIQVLSSYQGVVGCDHGIGPAGGGSSATPSPTAAAAAAAAAAGGGGGGGGVGMPASPVQNGRARTLDRQTSISSIASFVRCDTYTATHTQP